MTKVTRINPLLTWSITTKCYKYISSEVFNWPSTTKVDGLLETFKMYIYLPLTQINDII